MFSAYCKAKGVLRCYLHFESFRPGQLAAVLPVERTAPPLLRPEVSGRSP